jgi:hypothetical protein
MNIKNDAQCRAGRGKYCGHKIPYNRVRDMRCIFRQGLIFFLVFRTVRLGKQDNIQLLHLCVFRKGCSFMYPFKYLIKKHNKLHLADKRLIFSVVS